MEEGRGAEAAVDGAASARAAEGDLVARPGSVQTRLAVGDASMTRTDPDYEELTVANRVLGGTMGRLFRHLREEKGYTYGIGSSFSALQYRGDVVGVDAVRTAVTEAALTDCWPRSPRCATSRCRRASSRTPSARSAVVRALARESRRSPQLLRPELDLRPAGRLLGHLSGADRAVTAAQAQAAAAKYLDAVRAAHRRRRRRRQDRRHAQEEGDARDVRRRREAGEVRAADDVRYGISSRITPRQLTNVRPRGLATVSRRAPPDHGWIRGRRRTCPASGHFRSASQLRLPYPRWYESARRP